MAERSLPNDGNRPGGKRRYLPAAERKREILEAAVEDSEVLIRQWRAVRDGWPLRIHLLDGVVDGPDGGFCRSAEAHDPGVGMAPPYAVGQIGRASCRERVSPYV